jgi:hypothetical protein
MAILDKSRKKVSKTPFSTNKLGIVVNTCHPSYAGADR